MKSLLFSCVFALAMAAGTAGSEELSGSVTTPITDPVPKSAIALESNSIDLFADVLVVNDIGGTVDGVYEDANAALLSAVVNDAKAILASNVKISDIKLSNGMLLGDEAKRLVYAKAGKATEETFSGHAVEGSLDTLAPKESMPFFRELMDNQAIAPTYNVFMGKDRGQKHAADFAVTLPAGGLGGSSRYLLFVQASARHVPFGKTFGIAMATGMAGMTIGGGTGVYYYSMLMSGGSVNVALIDKQSAKVLWAMQRPIKDFNQVQITAIKLLRTLSRSLPSDVKAVVEGTPEKSPEVADTSAVQYRSIREAKVALRTGKIDRAEYDRVAVILESQYKSFVAGLKNKQQSGEISDAAFEILSAKSELEYTGVSG